MGASAPDRAALHAELERARSEFRALVDGASPAELRRLSDGTRWTNRELLFHMLFGYLVTRNLRLLVKLVSRLPLRAQCGFAAALDAATRPFDWVNFWGSRAGGRVVSPAAMAGWLDRVVAAMHRHLDRESDAALARAMAFPPRWDPYFAPRMTLADVYHYPTLHFDHHARQLTLGD
jgi:DinB superfamily